MTTVLLVACVLLSSDTVEGKKKGDVKRLGKEQSFGLQEIGSGRPGKAKLKLRRRKQKQSKKKSKKTKAGKNRQKGKGGMRKHGRIKEKVSWAKNVREIQEE